jgi:hypothetical protein
VALNVGVSSDLIKGGEVFCQSHLIVVIVNAVVAEAANKNALVKFVFRVGFLEAGSAVQLFGNQMVERQLYGSTTEGTGA